MFVRSMLSNELKHGVVLCCRALSEKAQAGSQGFRSGCGGGRPRPSPMVNKGIRTCLLGGAVGSVAISDENCSMRPVCVCVKVGIRLMDLADVEMAGLIRPHCRSDEVRTPRQSEKPAKVTSRRFFRDGPDARSSVDHWQAQKGSRRSPWQGHRAEPVREPECLQVGDPRFALPRLAPPQFAPP